MTMFEVLIAEQSLSNSELWNFPWSHVDVSGSHSKEQFFAKGGGSQEDLFLSNAS